VEFLAGLGFLVFGKGGEMLFQNGGGALHGWVGFGFVSLHQWSLSNTSSLNSNQR